MIRDGQFIKEGQLKIGKFYNPSLKRQYTYEEIFFQEVILKKETPTSKFEKLLRNLFERC